MLEQLFRIQERGSSVGTEIRAGMVTFLTMAYILFVNPQILSEAGMPVEDVTFATALAAAFATLVMGLYANYPFALAPGMGLNAFFVFGVVIGMGVSYQVALAAVFIEGILFLLLAVGGIRSAILNAIPLSLKSATMCGIGMFLAIVGFQNAGLIVSSPDTMIALGDLHTQTVILSLCGLLLVAVLMARKVPGAILIGILGMTIVAWSLKITEVPDRIVSLPTLPYETFFAFDFSSIVSGQLLMVILAFLFVDFFDTAGTLMGVGKMGGYLTDEGELPHANRAFTADALGTTVGALLGTSTVTSYIESATGIEEGGRTGLTAVVVAILFLLSLFLIPIFTSIPAEATAPALIVIGALMMLGARDIDWSSLDESLPAFLTIAAMPFTHSIAHGIAVGIVSFTFIKLLAGKGETVHGLMYVLTVLLLLYYGFVL